CSTLQMGGEERPAPITLTRGELPAVSQATALKTFAVRRSDLDVVQHVNNTQYLGWLRETVPGEAFAALRPAALELVFQREALYGDVVKSEAQPIAGGQDRAF